MKLTKFEEAIVWCDKGLAVSFDKMLLNSYNLGFLLVTKHEVF